MLVPQQIPLADTSGGTDVVKHVTNMTNDDVNRI